MAGASEGEGEKKRRRADLTERAESRRDGEERMGLAKERAESRRDRDERPGDTLPSVHDAPVHDGSA